MWCSTALGKLLQKSENWIQPDPTELYQQVTIKMWGQGVILRQQISGDNIKAKRQLSVKPRQFILSRIDARHGAFGIVPDHLDGALVSNDFPAFDINTSRLLPEFLNWMSKTASFIELCRAASEGTTNRVRLKEEKFLETEIPLPELDEQRRIVARIEELAAKVEEVRELRSQSIDMLSAVLKSAQRKLIGDQPESNWIPLSQVVTAIKNGKSPSCEKRPATLEEWGVLKVGVVSSGTYNPDENKALPTSIPPNPEYEVQVGDFLMSRANTTELVGSCAVVKETRSKLLLSDKIFRFIFNESADLLPDYLNHVMKSPALRLQIEQEATGTSSSMKNISKQKVFNLLIPDTPLAQQREIVSYLDNLQTKINTLRTLQTQTATELDALLPAILDKAFKGEL